MFYNAALHEMTARHIMRDRLHEAEEYRLLKRAEAARRPAPRRGLLAAIRQALAARRFIKPTAATG
ncbi:MAG: hypothetical protein ACRDF1_10650 [bacterium]